MKKIDLVLRLSGKKGESIVETLVAILIAALSCTILMTAVTAAVSINKNASEAQTAFEKELLEAEQQEGTREAQASIGVVVNENGSSTSESVSINVLVTGGDGKLASYKLAPKEEGD